MFTYDHQKRVSYGETDQMGYLYYGNYPLLYEIGRTESIRSLGLRYRDMEVNDRVMMPVLHMEARYLAPIKYDDNLTIRTIIKELPTKMIKFDHEIYNEDLELCHRAYVKLFFVDMDTNKRVTTPIALQQALKSYYE
ncbi:MAG: thioesterase family protein [Saprospiraceae bacterium]|jgi:acyl-CoA thioester hydrolase|nr:thioesterase family protein [Saprospiraceae bacterium]